VYVTADGWHLVIAICRDLLNPHALHALAECGVNLVLAPSMSETLVAFGGPVAQLVGSGQAVIAVANNPADWSDPDRPEIGGQPPRALFGHPGFPRLTRLVHAHDGDVGLAVLHVGLGQVSWLPVSERATAAPRPDSSPATSGPHPVWLTAFDSPSPLPAAPAPSAATLRPAAVLVVLVDADGGPEVLLTERAADLTHYGGQLVFPGGAADRTDPGIVDTALREAAEETGLDATTVHVIGTLPPFGLPETGFLVTPVLAWTRELRFTHRINPAEVAATRLLRLHSWSRELGERRLGADGTRLGVMTGTILEILAARFDRESSCQHIEHDMV
jgi:8-oxo-dGTP pyrophosphatase MutT (NUDIX family)